MDIYRTYNTTTHSLTKTANAYAGQMGDSLSTTLHFEYDDLGYLTDHQAFIVFAVYDSDGNPLVYGPSSTPSFDGLTFDIPWDVTSRITSRRIEYQLWFLAENVTWDGETWGDLDRTEVTMSAVDGIAIKPSIGPKCGRNQPFLPTATEPDILGWIRLWQNVGIVKPVTQETDDQGRYNIIFTTYMGENFRLTLDVPSLVDGKIPYSILDMVTDLAQTEAGEQHQIPSARGTLNWLTENYTSKSMAIPEWSDATTYAHNATVVYNGNLYVSLQDSNISHNPTSSPTYWREMEKLDILVSTWSGHETSETQAPTVKLVYDSLGEKMDEGDVVTSTDGWSNPLSDAKVPSEKLVKDSLDDKLDDSQVVTSWSGTVTDGKIPSEKLVKDSLDGKLDDTQVVQTLDSNAAHIPACPAVNSGLAQKTDIIHAIPVWTATRTFVTDSIVLESGKLFVSLRDGNTGNDPLEDTIEQWWSPISGGGGGGGETTMDVRTTQFGNTSDTTYDITHNFGAYDFVWSIRETGGSREYVQARVQALDRAKARVILSEPPGVNALTINMISLRARTFDVDIDVVEVLTQAQTWTWPNTTGQPVYVMPFDTSGNVPSHTVTQDPTDDFDAGAVVDFGSGNEYSGTMTIAKSGYVTMNSSSIWVLTHNLATLVAVQCYDSTTGEEVIGSVVQNGNTAVVSFSQAVDGYAVVVPATMIVEMDSGLTWTLSHNLGRYVAVYLFDDNYNALAGGTVTQVDTNTVSVTFATAQSGYLMII